MTPQDAEYQRNYLPRAVQRILARNPDDIIPVTKKAQENRLRRIAEEPARKLAEQEALEARKTAERAAEIEALRITRGLDLTPQERIVRQRLFHIWSEYGVSAQQLLQMLEKQDWRCAICQEAFEGINFHVDHSHLPPLFKVRGLLCRRCNLRIGGWDDPKWAKAAAAYLRIIPHKNDLAGIDLEPKELTIVAGQQRNLGRGMKPRGLVQPDPRAASVNAQEILPETDSENDDVFQNLRPSKDTNLAADPDSESEKDGFVAQIAQIDQEIITEEVPSNQLADLMKKSAEHNEAEISAGMANLLGTAPKPNAIDIALDPLRIGIYIPSQAEIDAIGKSSGGYDIPRDQLPTIAELEEAMANGAKVDLQPDGRVIITQPLGEQPDGTFKIVVTIPEGYISSIQQQADSDHETPEQWVSKNFAGWLESWWAPPRNA